MCRLSLAVSPYNSEVRSDYTFTPTFYSHTLSTCPSHSSSLSWLLYHIHKTDKCFLVCRSQVLGIPRSPIATTPRLSISSVHLNPVGVFHLHLLAVNIKWRVMYAEWALAVRLGFLTTLACLQPVILQWSTQCSLLGHSYSSRHIQHIIYVQHSCIKMSIGSSGVNSLK